MIRHYEATVIHDMVYATLGLLEKRCPLGFKLPIHVHYEHSAREVYLSTAFYLIKHSASLVALSIIEEPEHRMRQDLPSWVLDFGSPPKAQSLSIRSIGRYFNACGICISSPESRKLSNATLEIQDAFFDMVTDVTSQVWDGIVTAEGSVAIMKFLEEAFCMFSITDAYSGNTESRFKILTQILLCGKRTLKTPPELMKLLGDDASENEDAAIFFRFWALTVARKAKEFGHSIESVLESLETLKEQDPLSASTLFDRADIEEISEAVNSAVVPTRNLSPQQFIDITNIWADTFAMHATESVYYKKLYRTSKGYLGYGRSSMQAGDEIWMLCGGRSPFVLRPAFEGGKYILIGETYLHGCMEGEMITEELKARIGPVSLI
ncbi:hypothetical protein N431DRAFT_477654 [Stipitochalara longipes BDJ]|nr:hypothetical protein N431DRAFT_477654 [Stipitochalara longipes BDJ]